MKRKSGRVVLLFGVLVVVLLAVAAILLLSPTGGGGGVGGLIGGGPQVTPTPRTLDVVLPRSDIPAGTYITITELFRTEETTQTRYAGADYLHDLNEVVEQVALVRLSADVPVRFSQLGEPGLAERMSPGKRAFALQVDVLSGIVGHLKENDYVDVVLTGNIEEYLPQLFPLEIPYTSPEGRPAPVERRFPWTDIEPFRMLSVKTVVEDIRVLEVISITSQPAAKTNATPTPGPSGLPAGWILILEVNQQQAEVFRFALDQGWPFQLLLRPYDDHVVQHDPAATTGITSWILLDANGPYRMPIPRAIPYQITPGNIPAGYIP